MSKKSHKVGEPAAPYAVKKPVKGKIVVPATQAAPSEVRYASAAQVKKAADEVFKVHAELFRKLAQ